MTRMKRHELNFEIRIRSQNYVYDLDKLFHTVLFVNYLVCKITAKRQNKILYLLKHKHFAYEARQEIYYTTIESSFWCYSSCVETF
jgi:hypothetical protein